MNIWIFNHHALTPDMIGGTRHYDFAIELIKRGHNVTIVASSFHYSRYIELKEYDNKKYLQEFIDGINFIWLKTPSYKGNGISRVINMISYSLTVLKLIPKLKLDKPNVIVGSSVHLFAVFSAYRLAKKFKAPFVMEVRDLWPQTLIDMGVFKWHPFIIILGILEKFLYRKADKIITCLPNSINYIGEFTSKEKIEWISNGVNLSSINYCPKQLTDTFTISYTGALGIANNMQLFLEAAKRLQNRKNISFRIVGEGKEKLKLVDFVLKNNLSNVTIEEPVQKKMVSDILENSDVLFLSLKDLPLYRFGISLNKLFDYMASGRVIILAGNLESNPLKEANAGYVISPNNVNKLVETILEIYSLPNEDRVEIGLKLREHVLGNYSIEKLSDKYELVLNDAYKKLK